LSLTTNANAPEKVMTTETYILRHEQCPRCHEQGRDNGKDNLGVYSDGHSWCYSCGFIIPGSAIKRFLAEGGTTTLETYPQSRLALPGDATRTIPTEPANWFYSYGFTANTATKHHVMWSESRQMLLFPYFIEGELLGWQGRTFGDAKAGRKWFTQGKVDDFIYTIGPRSSTLVLAESIISAIKISRVAEASPIFGSTISNQRLLRINKLYGKIVIWLDPDKRTTALKAARTAQLFGLDTHVVLSDMKPKDYTIPEIEKWIEN